MGICLGMQRLRRGNEERYAAGLGLIDADVKEVLLPIELKLKVPHLGWNIVRPESSNPLIPHTEEEQRFYFVHSYKVVPDDPRIVIGTVDYGGEFCTAFQRDNIFGVQFHPAPLTLNVKLVDLWEVGPAGNNWSSESRSDQPNSIGAQRCGRRPRHLPNISGSARKLAVNLKNCLLQVCMLRLAERTCDEGEYRSPKEVRSPLMSTVLIKGSYEI